MPKSQAWHITDARASIPATIGGLFLLSTPNPIPHIPRSRLLVTDKYGGRLYLSGMFGTPRTVLRAHLARSSSSALMHSQVVFHYKIDGEWSFDGEIAWQLYIDRMRDLVILAFLIDGPYILDDTTIFYAKSPEQHGYRTREHRPHATQPLAYPRYSLGITTVPKRFETIVSTCKHLHASLFDYLTLHPGSRWNSTDKRIVQGTRLELAIRLMGDATQWTHLYDMPIRLSIAFEALFQCKMLDRGAIKFICAYLLRATADPDEVLRWLLTLTQWRDKFVHGEEAPFRYPPAAKQTERLVAASECGYRLLIRLIRTIIHDKRLHGIFHTTGNDMEFADALYKYCTR